ncbi:MAG: HPr family phosphocarrier protein [Alphaproteobacteria bacterium]|nr:HPr family phosphocarrier protein [Alphaproteobacteria bacterium]
MAQGKTRKKSLCRRVKIRNERGLHARAAAKFVRCASSFNSEVVVARRGTVVSGLSIMGLLTLAASRGTLIEIRAEGGEAREALDILCTLVRNGFEED